jgi:hypothetical protein
MILVTDYMQVYRYGSPTELPRLWCTTSSGTSKGLSPLVLAAESDRFSVVPLDLLRRQKEDCLDRCNEKEDCWVRLIFPCSTCILFFELNSSMHV